MEKRTQPASSKTTTETSSPPLSSVSKESRTSVGNENVTNSAQTITTATHNHTKVYPTEEHQPSQQPVSATVTKEPLSTIQTVSSTKTVAVTTGTTTVKTTAKTTATSTISSTTMPTLPKPAEDYRITPVYQYDKKDNILSYLDFEYTDSNCTELVKPGDFVNPFFSWENCADLSDSIVSGTVISLTYTREENVLWTQVDMEITEVYKGTLHPRR